jgi:hypothetical protein
MSCALDASAAQPRCPKVRPMNDGSPGQVLAASHSSGILLQPLCRASPRPCLQMSLLEPVFASRRLNLDILGSMPSMPRLRVFTELKPTFWSNLSEGEQFKCRGHASTLIYKDKTAWNIEGSLLTFWESKLLPTIQDVCNDDNNKVWIHRGQKVQMSWVTLPYLLGPATAPKQAKPTVFVLSSSNSFNRKTASLLRKHATIANLDHGFDILGHKELVRLQAGGILPEGMALSPPGGGRTLFGSRFTSVPMSASSTSERRHATIGGIIKIGGLYHGVTVAHTFVQGQEAPVDTSDSSNDSDTDDQTEEASISSSTAEDDGRDETSHLEDAASFHAYSIYLDPRQTTNSVVQSDTVAGDDYALTSIFLGNMVVPPSHQYNTEEDDLDNALICPPHISRDLDWALIEIQDRRHMVPNIIAKSPGTDVTVTSVAALNTPPMGEVFVGGGGGGEVPDRSKGHGHGATIGLALPGTRKLQSVWTIDYKCGKSINILRNRVLDLTGASSWTVWSLGCMPGEWDSLWYGHSRHSRLGFSMPHAGGNSFQRHSEAMER